MACAGEPSRGRGLGARRRRCDAAAPRRRQARSRVPRISPRASLILGNPDGHELHSVDRPGVVAGRIPDPSDETALVINETAARLHHLTVGSRLPRRVLRRAGPARELVGEASAACAPAHLASRRDRPAVRRRDPRLRRPSAERFVSADPCAVGADRAPRLAVRRARRDAARPRTGGRVRTGRPPGRGFQRPRSPGDLGHAAARAPQATGRTCSRCGCSRCSPRSAGGGVVTQLSTRQQRGETASQPVLRALGASRRDLVFAAALRALFIGATAAVVAIAVAWVGSALMPIGPMRILEPHRGFDFDAAVIGWGALAVLLLLLVLGVVVAVRRRAPRPRRASRLGDALARSGAPVPAVAGVRLALDPGRGEAAVPVWSTVVGVGLALAALVATFGYAASLSRFTSTPRLYGWVWTAQVELGDTTTVGAMEHAAATLTRDPGVHAAVGGYAQMEIGGKTVGAVALQPDRGRARGRGRARARAGSGRRDRVGSHHAAHVAPAPRRSHRGRDRERATVVPSRRASGVPALRALSRVGADRARRRARPRRSTHCVASVPSTSRTAPRCRRTRSSWSTDRVPVSTPR